MTSTLEEYYGTVLIKFGIGPSVEYSKELVPFRRQIQRRFLVKASRHEKTFLRFAFHILCVAGSCLSVSVEAVSLFFTMQEAVDRKLGSLKACCG